MLRQEDENYGKVEAQPQTSQARQAGRRKACTDARRQANAHAGRYVRLSA